MRLKSFLLGILVFVLGLLMTIMPQKFFNAIIIIAGLTALVDGIYSIIKIRKETEDIRKPVTIRSTCCIVVGLSAVVFPIIFRGAIDFVCMIFGFILAVTLVAYAAFGFFTAGRLSDDEKKKNLTSESLISLLIAIILFILPIKSITTTITRIVGIISIVVGIILIAYEIILQFAHKKDSVEIVAIKDDEENDSTAENDSETEDPEKTGKDLEKDSMEDTENK